MTDIVLSHMYPKFRQGSTGQWQWSERPRCLMSSSTPQPHRDMENISVLRVWAAVEWMGRLRPPQHWQDRSALLGAKCELTILMHHQYKLTMYEERAADYTGGWKYPFLPCLRPLICLCQSQAITMTQTQHVLPNMLYCKWAFIFSFIQEMEEQLAILKAIAMMFSVVAA